MGWAMDFCAQALREIVIGLGGDMDGFMMRSGFQITVSSELMAILAVASDLADMRRRIARMVVAYAKNGDPVTAADLQVDGAMTALMVKAINPNLLQTIEGQPVLVHAGPFANIAVGQSSIIADRVGLKLSDYHITESGFGADIGFEKFWNLKCRFSGLTPHASVIVCTVRALKMHGGGPKVVPGKPLDKAYIAADVGLVEKGLENLLAHVATVKLSGIEPVVCINHFATDSDEEVAVVRRAAEKAGARVAVSKHWEKGGEGARELSEVVIEACSQKPKFRFLYETSTPLSERIRLIATKVYGADGVTVHAARPGAGEEVRGRPRADEVRHLHGEDPPVAVPRPVDQGPAEGLDASHPRRAALPGRGLRGAGGGRHQADARHLLGPRVPQHRRGHGHRQGEGTVLAVLVYHRSPWMPGGTARG